MRLPWLEYYLTMQQIKSIINNWVLSWEKILGNNPERGIKMDEPKVTMRHSVGMILLDNSRPSDEKLASVIDEIIRAVAPHNRKVVEGVKSDLLKSSNNTR